MTGKPPVAALVLGIALHVNVIVFPSLTVHVSPVGATYGTSPGVVKLTADEGNLPVPQVFLAYTLTL